MSNDNSFDLTTILDGNAEKQAAGAAFAAGALSPLTATATKPGKER